VLTESQVDWRSGFLTEPHFYLREALAVVMNTLLAIASFCVSTVALRISVKAFVDAKPPVLAFESMPGAGWIVKMSVTGQHGMSYLPKATSKDGGSNRSSCRQFQKTVRSRSKT